MRISPGTLILGMFAVLFGLAGAYYAKYYMQPPAAVAAVAEEEAEVLAEQILTIPVAGDDLVAGRTVTFNDIVVHRVTRERADELGLPTKFMPASDQIIGQTLRDPMAANEGFLPEMFYPEGMGPSVAERLEPGYRAITIPLENSPAELAMVSPGMAVDIVFRSSPDPTVNLPETTVTLLERVEVLAIGEEMLNGVKGASTRNTRGSRSGVTVTLSVVPEQARALKVVENRGDMSLVVRGDRDEMLIGDVGPQTLASLLNIPPPKAPTTTQIYRRGQMTTMVFEGGVQTEVVNDTPAPTSLPVVAAPRPSPAVHTISHSIMTSASKKNTSSSSQSGCGCGSSKD